MWILVWLIVAFIILGATMWSTIILVQQKQAWAAYAKKNNLRFIRGKFFAPAEMNGEIGEYDVSFFTAEQQNLDERKNKFLTVVQVTIDESFVDGFAAVSPEMRPFLESLDTIKKHKPKTKGWDKNNYLSSRNRDVVEAYLTEERLKVITSLLNMKSADVLVLSDESNALIRIETSNPLQQVDQIEKLIKNVFARIEKLKVGEEERAVLNAIPKDGDSDTVPTASAPASVQENNESAPLVDSEGKVFEAPLIQEKPKKKDKKKSSKKEAREKKKPLERLPEKPSPQSAGPEKSSKSVNKEDDD